MTDNERRPLDAFADINLDEFKSDNVIKAPVINNSKLEKEAIRKVAEESDFQSRQAIVKRKKIIPKTFSLFQEECDVINQALKYYLDNPDERLSQPSGSDVVRAALYVFATKNAEEQVQLIKAHRGRGRK